ncbi:unnamed protein product [Eruca vesicaria subsp. sativa]|uniref:Late embryogenesis abundant protein LEA-2 subgroup domain-containing protein n=1 Tax=Eruca vesicaria subsp. sativa TaxID=29727 RepID=A0ABC8L6N6_ERUVS|nr:unnamed protein product [Eruca vesicaria subsp. sativa]
MHAKTDSEATSIDVALSWLPRSPPRSATRPLYYVQSPSNHDVEKMSFGSGCSPMGSPSHPHFYHCSPIHHSRESSTSRFSDRALLSYKSIREGNGRRRYINSAIDEETDGGDDDDLFRNVRLYGCLLFSLFLLFSIFSLILWGASKSYPPKVVVKGMLVSDFNVQAGNDLSGVPTDMLSLNSTVRIFYRNPSTFFAVHVTASPLLLHYSNLLLSSGEMEKFTVGRKSERSVATVVHGHQIPLYGSVSPHLHTLSLPLNLTLVLSSRAYILGRLVTSKFHTRIICSFTLNANRLPKPMSLIHSCTHHH